MAGRTENATSMLEEIRTALVKLFNTVTMKKRVQVNSKAPLNMN